MTGRRLILAFLGFLAVFAGALVYFQFFAYYERDRGGAALVVGDRTIAMRDLDRIDAATSPLKLRACFRTDPAAFEGLPRAEAPTPLTPPPWFGCFDTGAITAALAAGEATAYLLERDAPAGFNLMVAVYPDGRAYLWRQLNERFSG